MKPHQRFRSEKHDVFIKEVNKIALSANDDKRTRLINSIETYAYRTSKDLVCKKEGIKCNIIKQYKKRLILMMSQKKYKRRPSRLATNS